MPCLPRRVPGTLALCIAAVVGCNSSNHLAPKQTGSMTVTITADTGATTLSVVVSGPNSYSKTVTGTETLSGLAVGTYTIVADSIVSPDSVIGSAVNRGAVTGSPATIANATTSAVTVSYTMHHLGGLWIANNNSSTIPELSSNQLRATGTPTPAETLVTNRGPAGLALEANGNMWESSWKSDSLFMYTPADRNAGVAAPSRIIFSTAAHDAEAMAVDARGTLWVANRSPASILGFTASQLAAGGAQTPIAISGSVLTKPNAIAFDTYGNAWVADYGSTHLIEYSAATLATTGSPTPLDTIGTTGGKSLFRPVAVAFDANGNLWVANNGNGTVVEYTPAQLAAGGVPVPHITLTVLPNPWGLAFDRRGTLWVSFENHSSVYGLTSSQLTASGTPTPAVVVTSTASSFSAEQLLFDPNATAMGIATSRVRAGRPRTAVDRTIDPDSQARPNR